MRKNILKFLAVGLLILSLAGCSLSEAVNTESTSETTRNLEETTNTQVDENDKETSSESVVVYEDSILDLEDIFSNRDLEQEADLSEASYIELVSDENIIISEEGIYVFTGDVLNTTIVIEAENEDKVQLVLDGISIVNEEAPAIYVKSVDKVFITTTDSYNLLEVSGKYEEDGDTNLDAVIYSKDDLVLNGLGEITIVSEEGNGITSKDDLKITGGTYNITSADDSLEANDSIRIYDGTFNIVTGKDGLHSEYSDDLSLGYIYILDGSFNIEADDDAIHGSSIIQIDGGTITVTRCTEGIEATYIQINGGIIDIYATDDGINATSISDLDVVIEVNDGDITINMASGDTDGFDANGDIIINGGNVDVTGGSTFDADGSAILNAGTVIVNGEEVTELPTQSFGKKRG